jgi:hypothetical protein
MADVPLKSGQEVFLYRIASATEPLGMGKVEQVSDRRIQVRFDVAHLHHGGRDLMQREIFLRWEGEGLREEWPVVVNEVHADMLILVPRGKERRESLRLQVRLPLFYEIVDPQLAEGEAVHILAGTGSEDEVAIESERFWHSEDLGERMEEQFNQLSRFLSQVDSKLDYLIALAEGREVPQPAGYQVYMLDISGAGLSFLDSRVHELGTLLKTRVQINRFPLEEIATLSKVVRCLPFEGQEGRFEIGVRFETVRGVDREKIFHFISRAERTILRQRKEHLTP